MVSKLNSNCDKTQILTKIYNFNCDKTQKPQIENNSKTQTVTKFKNSLLQNSTQIVTKLKNSNCDKTQKQ